MEQAAPSGGSDEDDLMMEDEDDAALAEPTIHPGEDLDHIAAVLSDLEGRLQGRGPSLQRRRLREPAQQAAGRPRAAHGSGAPEGSGQAGVASGEGGHGGGPGGRQGKASSAGAAGPSIGIGSAYDQPGPQSTRRAWFCEACDCWVPVAGVSGKSLIWLAHLAGGRHRRQSAAAARSGAAPPLEPAANQESTSYYRSRVLPAMKHAAEELRSQRESAGECGSAPFLRQAARSADAVLRGDGSVAGRVEALHAAAMKELLHHCGASSEFHRLASRLSRERLACAWPYLAQKDAAYIAPRPEASCEGPGLPVAADQVLLGGGGNAHVPGALTLLGATPGTVACLAAMLPDLAAPTIVLSVGCQHAMDMAATTAALCLLARAVRNAPKLRRLQLSLLAAKPDMGPTEQVADRHAQLVGLVLRALRDSLSANCTLELLSLRVLEPAKVAQDWADLRAVAAQAPYKLRIAALCALHPREAGRSPLAWLPQQLLRDLLDAALPLGGCRVHLRMR